MSEKPWYDKSNEKVIGHLISRLPEWNSFEYGQPLKLHCRLEELLIAYDKLVKEKEGEE